MKTFLSVMLFAALTSTACWAFPPAAAQPACHPEFGTTWPVCAFGGWDKGVRTDIGGLYMDSIWIPGDALLQQQHGRLMLGQHGEIFVRFADGKPDFLVGALVG